MAIRNGYKSGNVIIVIAPEIIITVVLTHVRLIIHNGLSYSSFVLCVC